MEKIKIGSHFEFEASHQLPDKECYGKCRFLHGHRYELEVQVAGTIDGDGWICNFSEIKDIVKEHVISKLDHAHLNDIFEIPTVENITLWIFQTLNRELSRKPYVLSKIRLYETSKSYAEMENLASGHNLAQI